MQIKIGKPVSLRTFFSVSLRAFFAKQSRLLRRSKTLLAMTLCIFSFSLLPSLSLAEDIAFEASVTSNKIALNNFLQLTLTVTGVRNSLSPVNLPIIDGFESQYLGPATSISIANGNYHSERSFTYQLKPLKIGTFEIPSIVIQIDGKSYTSTPISITVTDISEAEKQEQASLNERIRISFEIGKTNAIVGEKIPVSIKLWVNQVPFRNISPAQIEAKGFFMDPLSYKQYSQIDNGINYNVVEFNTHVYPQTTGDLALGPTTITGNIMQERNNPGIDDSIFRELLGAYTTKPMTATSKPLTIRVEPLPQEGKGDNFSGAIGNFDFTLTASPAEVKVGDPVTLTMTISGDGMLNDVTMPIFNASGFKSYEPQLTQSASSKKIEQVIIPTDQTIKEIPALSFEYFDSQSRQYKTITRGPIPITVSAAAVGEEFKAVGYNDLTKQNPNSPLDFPWQKILLGAKDKVLLVLKNIWFWIVLGGIGIITFGFMMFRRYEDRLNNDPLFARSQKAYKKALSELEKANDLMKANDTKAFYAQLEKTLLTFIADKMHKPKASLTIEAIERVLRTKPKFNESQFALLKNLIEKSHTVMFAQMTVSTMSQDLANTRHLITHLQEILK